MFQFNLLHKNYIVSTRFQCDSSKQWSGAAYFFFLQNCFSFLHYHRWPTIQVSNFFLILSLQGCWGLGKLVKGLVLISSQQWVRVRDHPVRLPITNLMLKYFYTLWWLSQPSCKQRMVVIRGLFLLDNLQRSRQSLCWISRITNKYKIKLQPVNS